MDRQNLQTYSVQDLMLNFGQQELEEAVQELGAAIESQEQWYSDLNRTLICHLPPNIRDLSREAHHLCAFGAWLDVYGNDKIRKHSLFEKIKHDHELIHYVANKLLSKTIQDEKIEPDEYQAMYKIENKIRNHLHTLNNELKDKVSNIDSLTGLYNRKEMYAQLNMQYELVNRDVYPVSIALMDIDHFKEINDKYGHVVGDKILSQLAAFLDQAVRVYDTVFRYGGDEFFILLTDTKLETAYEVLKRIHKKIGSLQVPYNGSMVTATTSFGVSSLRKGEDIEYSIENADQALYQAKKAGRNQLVMDTVH